MPGLVDRHMQWMRKRLWIDPFSMLGLANDGTSGVTLMGSIDDLTELWAELSSFGFGAVKFSADGKFIGGALPCPYDLDPDHEVGFRIHWTVDATGSTAAVEWLLLQDTIKRGVVIAAASTALDTVLVDDANADDSGSASSTDYLYQVTPRGIRTKIGLSRAQIEDGALITLKLEQQGATAETNVYLLGITMDYAPMRCVGMGNEILPPLESSGVS